MKKYFTSLFFVLIASMAIGQENLEGLLKQYNTSSIPYISVQELRMHQVNGAVTILDSREREEFEVSHLKGAKHVGFNHFSIVKISEEITNKNTPIIVYCSLGIRSEEIGEKLKKAGYTNVKNLYGGIFEWKNNAYPILNNTQKETDSVHTFSKEWSKWLHSGIKVYKTNKK